MPDFLVLVNIKTLQFSEVACDSSHSIPTQIILRIPQFLKVREVSRYNKCSLVAVVVVAYAQIGELKLAEC